MLAQGLPIAAAAVRAVPAAREPAVGIAGGPRRRDGLVRRAWRPASISELALSDAVAFRVDFDGTPPPPRAALLARAGAVAVRRPRMAGAVADSRRTARRKRPHAAALHGHARAERSPVAVRARLSVEHAADRFGCRRNGRSRRRRRLFARAAVADARARHAAAALYGRVDAARQLCRARRRAMRSSIRARRPATRAPSSSRARCERANPDDRRFIGAVLQWFRDEPFVYTLAPPLLERRSGRRVPVRLAPRLLRALRERVRRHAARRRHSRRAS